MGKKELTFRVDAIELLTEIADSGLPRTMGVLKTPLNILMNYLAQVAYRATELNDPKLNVIMLSMGLYEVSPDNVVEVINEQKKLIENE